MKCLKTKTKNARIIDEVFEYLNASLGGYELIKYFIVFITHNILKRVNWFLLLHIIYCFYIDNQSYLDERIRRTVLSSQMQLPTAKREKEILNREEFLSLLKWCLDNRILYMRCEWGCLYWHIWYLSTSHF